MKERKTYRQLAVEFKNTKSERIYTQLYNKMRPALLTYVTGIVKDRDVASDIVSTTLTTVYNNIDQYDQTYQITTWAYKIAYNECMGWLKFKKKSVSINVFTDAGVDPPTLNHHVDTVVQFKTDDDFLDELNTLTEQHRLVIEAIHELPDMYKPYMIKRFINDEPYQTILNDMILEEPGISLQTVKNRIFRGRRLIRQKLQNKPLFVNSQYI